MVINADLSVAKETGKCTSRANSLAQNAQSRRKLMNTTLVLVFLCRPASRSGPLGRNVSGLGWERTPAIKCASSQLDDAPSTCVTRTRPSGLLGRPRRGARSGGILSLVMRVEVRSCVVIWLHESASQQGFTDECLLAHGSIVLFDLDCRAIAGCHSSCVFSRLTSHSASLSRV